MTDTAPDAGLPARRAAFRILCDVLTRRLTLDDAQTRCTLFSGLEARDKGLVRLLVSTVLRHTAQLDALLRPLLHTPPEKLDPPQLLHVLRLGAAQAVFLKTPPHAAVSTAVDLAAAEGMARQKSLVNATLRRLARENAQVETPASANFPAWLMEEWQKDYGDAAGDIALALLTDSPVDFTVKGDAEKWAGALGAAVLPSGSLRLPSAGFVPALPGFDEGAWWVQNAAAALPARLFGDVAGRTIVDLCAAPGGKTAQLAAMGADVVAVDRAVTRLSKLAENLSRLNLSAAAVTADGTEWQPPAHVSAVLLDAPCTATGTIRHQPDILHLKTRDDQDRLAGLQRQLLRNAVKMLAPGGTLVYCTCSLQKAEGEAQADWLLAQDFPLALSPIRPGEIPGIDEMLTPRGELRCLPTHWAAQGGMDGFYAARFTRA